MEYGRKGRTSEQGVKLLYIRDYLREYATKDHPKNAQAIIDYLASKSIRASRQTIYNDILRLQTDFGEPIEYNAGKYGYYISKPLFAPYELRMMVDSIQSSKFITQAEARTISNKIKGLADVYTRDSLNRTAYVANRVRSMNESVVRDADKIHQAIATNRKIGFRYFHYTPNPDNPKVYYKKGDPYKVSPFALHWDNGNYYLYAYVDDKRGFRSFRVDRMERITPPLSEEREAVEQFKAENITSQEAKVFQSYHGERHTVKIRFSNHLADAVIDQFGKEAMLMPTDEKHFTLTTPIEISPPFFAWLATFGRGAKILYPDPVIEKMRDFIRRCADMYENEEEG